jgi:N utilization substance protein B
MINQKQKLSSRRLSRIAIVQLLYQQDQTLTPANLILKDFAKAFDFYKYEGNVNEDFIKEVVIGVLENKDELDNLISNNLSEEWKIERIANLVKMIIRSGIWELKNHLQTPTSVIINEYIEVTREFFTASEISFVHGILDKVGKIIRTL